MSMPLPIVLLWVAFVLCLLAAVPAHPFNVWVPLWPSVLLVIVALLVRR